MKNELHTRLVKLGGIFSKAFLALLAGKSLERGKESVRFIPSILYCTRISYHFRGLFQGMAFLFLMAFRAVEPFPALK